MLKDHPALAGVWGAAPKTADAGAQAVPAAAVAQVAQVIATESAKPAAKPAKR
jgi:hypothetical protein